MIPANQRLLKHNLVLGSLAAFTAGAVNVLSFMIFFAFTTNVTGYYAIMGAELARGNFYQVAVVLAWIFLFFLGAFSSKFILITVGRKQPALARAMPVVLQMLCLVVVGAYGQFFYQETLNETEVLLSLLVYAMGLQNGFTAGMTNFTVKTTHLTGATTDVGILMALFTQKRWRNKPEMREKAWLQLSVIGAYMVGGIASGLAQGRLGFTLFYLVCLVLAAMLVYEHRFVKAPVSKQPGKRKEKVPEYEEISR